MKKTIPSSAAPADSADREERSGLVFAPSCEGYALIDYMGPGKKVAIPAEHNGLPVVAIGKGALSNKGLREVSIPGTVAVIGHSALAWNDELAGVSIPDGVVYIGELAFAGNNLQNVSIPDTVASIGNSAFTWNKLFDIVIGRGVASINGGAFMNNMISAVAIPENVFSVGLGVFSGNRICGAIMPADVEICNDESMGVYGASFRKFYEACGRRAGAYAFDGRKWAWVERFGGPQRR